MAATQTQTVTDEQLEGALSGRSARITVYLEPELQVLADRYAQAKKTTSSGLLRDMMFDLLCDEGMIPVETLRRLAKGKGRSA